MWFNIVKPRFLFKTVDLWSYIKCLAIATCMHSKSNRVCLLFTRFGSQGIYWIAKERWAKKDFCWILKRWFISRITLPGQNVQKLQIFADFAS